MEIITNCDGSKFNLNLSMSMWLTENNVEEIHWKKKQTNKIKKSTNKYDTEKNSIRMTEKKYLVITSWFPHILENGKCPGISLYTFPVGKCPWKLKKGQNPGFTLEIFIESVIF